MIGHFDGELVDENGKIFVVKNWLDRQKIIQPGGEINQDAF